MRTTNLRGPFPPAGRYRRGVVSLWTILVLPVLVILFAVVVEGVHLWLARVELENGLEAAALAAVKEWAESGVAPGLGWTDVPRTIGQEYAAANTINQTPISIDKNLAPGPFSATNPNENRTCAINEDGNLILGAITEEDPYVFEADIVPGCGGIAELQLEVTSNGLEGNNDDAWGISYPATQENIDNDLLISKVVINLDPGNTNELRFDFVGNGPRLSDNSNSGFFVNGPAPDNTNTVVQSAQHDNYGFIGWFNTTSPSNPNPPSPDGAWPGGQYSSPQVVFTPTTGNPEVLTIDFLPLNTDAGFEVGDRLRFGTDVERRSGGPPNNPQYSTADGDDIGDVGVEITVYFVDRLGNPVPSDGSGFTSTYVNTGFTSNQCAAPNDPGEWVLDGLGNYHLLVHPSRNIPSPGVNPFDLPCPLTSAANNDKQSIAGVTGGGAGRNFAVHAQARHQVPSLICGFCGISFGPFYVAACTTAMYDCDLARPRLIRVEPENYYCPTRP